MDGLAERVQALFATLHSKSPHRGPQAAEIASDLYTLCIESVSETKLAYSSSVLFSKENGILRFLREAASLEEFASCKEQLLNLIGAFVENLKEKILPYAVEIKEVCNTLFSRDKASKVKNASFPPLIAVLKLCARSPVAESLNIPKITDKFFQACLKPTKHTSTVRGGIFQLLGTLCEVYPECMVPHSERLVDIYVRTLRTEMVKKGNKKPEMSVISGCLRGLCSYLINFSQSVAEGSAYAQDIYKFSRMAIDPQVSLTRYEVPRAGLSLIAKHAAQFKEYLAKDHEHMYSSLVEWSQHNNRENKNIALNALEAFLQQVSIHIVENASKDHQTNYTIFKEFIRKFRDIIDKQSSRPRELAVAIKGYGYFAAPCKIFLKPSDIQFMFSEMVGRSEQLFFSPVESSEDHLMHLPSFLEALASIVKEMGDLSESFLHSLEKLMVLLFECFPHLPPVSHKPTFFAVMKMIFGLAGSRTTLKTFLSHVVYQGLIRTCSHPPVIEVGDSGVVAMDTTDVLGNKRPSYLDYLSLWEHIMDPTKLKGQSLHFQDPGMRQTVHQMIYDEVISSLLKIIHRLDLTSRTLEEELTAESHSPPADQSPPSMTSDPMTGLQPTVPKDFQIFINLVDLCKSILLEVQPRMFRQWVYTFGHEVIVQSSHLPLISGFYKLLATCLKICKTLNYFQGVQGQSLAAARTDSEVAMETDTDSSDRKDCFILFRKFVKEVVVRMKQYKDELLVSCLQLLLSLPNELVELEIESLVPALQTTFKLGLSYLPLANAGLSALELWSSQLPVKLLHPQLKHILPSLDEYLKTLGTNSDSDSNASTVVVQSRSTRGGRMPIKAIAKWKEGIEGAESPHNKVRRRIVHFLGSLGGQVNSSLVENESAAAFAARAVAWDNKNRLEFALPFQDMKPSLYFDPFLPRVCELATTASDRQTKIAACELLHALILYMIGKGAQPVAQNKSPMTKLYRKVFPYILQLACDVEKVTEQLFRPLVFQMIHWFTKNTQYESPDTIALLDAILDSIVHPTDTSLRDFAAACVKEFLSWSIKQTNKKQQEKSPINTKSLLKRIYSLAGHPSASKRLGAALAINNIYTVFREEESLVDIFVIEMLVVMVNSLKLAHKDDKSLGTQEQTCKAIGHISRVIRFMAPKLNTCNKKRRVPKGMKFTDLTNLVIWTLTQCGSPETECRRQCIELFGHLACLVPKISTARVWIRKTFESEGGYFFVSRFEKGEQGRGVIQKQPVLNKGVFSLSGTITWFEGLMAALDCYNWVLNEQLLAPSEVFQAKPKKSTDKPSCLFESLHFFISKLSLHGLEAAVHYVQQGCNSIHTPKEIEEYNRAKCAVIVKVMKFATVLLDKHPGEAFTCVPEMFWSDDLYQLVSSSCLCPTSVGFSSSDVQTMDLLPSQVKEIMQAITNTSRNGMKSSFAGFLSSQLSPGSATDLIGQLPLYFLGNDDQRRDHNQLDYVIKGHILLQRTGLLMPALGELGHTADTVCTKLLESVLGTLKPLVASFTVTCHRSVDQGSLSPASEHSTGLLLQLALDIGITFSTLVDLLLDKDNESPGLGLLLYQSFPTVLNNHFLAQCDLLISLLVGNSSSNSAPVSAILNGFLEHISRDKGLMKSRGATVCACLLSHWKQLGSWWGDSFDPNNRLAAINLLKKMFVIDPKILVRTSESGDIEPVFSMYVSLVEETQSSLAFKSKVLEILHHFTDLPADFKQRLKKSINTLIAKQFPLKSDEFPRGSPQFNDYISVIDKLLNALVVSGSLVLLEVLINIMCRENKHVHEDRIQTSLIKFVKDLSSNSASQALSTSYQVFTNETNYPPDARRAACERVCIPLLKSCSEVSLRDFYLEHTREMMEVIEAKISKTGIESNLMSKLCCFQFMEVLYSRLPSGALSSPESKINSVYCKGQPKTGKELTQAATKAGHMAKSEDLHGDKTHYELRRQYHCMAYNMLLAVISCTQNKIQFYTGFLFKEDILKGQFLWDNLVDHERQYHFETELESPEYRKKQMMAIRDEVHAQGSREGSPVDSPPFSPRYLSSQYLADSSLSTDISQFDFSAGPQAFPQVRISSSPEVEEDSSYVMKEEQIEQDEVNTHECMISIMRLFDHMEHNKINPEAPKGSSPTEMHSWMIPLHKKFNDSKTNQNVRIFIAKLIINRPKMFQPYAKFWLTGLTQFIVGGNHGGVGLHCFVVDLVVTMLSWSSTAVLEDQYLASSLLNYMMQHAYHDNRSVFRNNLEIIKTLVEICKSKLQTPTKLVYGLFTLGGPESKSNTTGVQLLGILVANKMPAYEPTTAGTLNEQQFFMALISLMSSKYKQVYGAAAEVLGISLANMEEDIHFSLGNLRDATVEQLMKLVAERNEQNFLTCLHKIQQSYPKITDRFVEKLLFLLPNFHGLFRSMCLEILRPQADVRPQFFLELKDKGFINMISHRDEPTQTAALEIVKRMVQHHHLDTEQTVVLLPLVTVFGSHSSEPCRVLMYDILITLYNNANPGGSEPPPTDEGTKDILVKVKDQLLQGLSDDSETLRLKMYSFWNEESRLSADTLSRLTQLFAVLYSTGTEGQFLYHSTNLLLELTSRSPDFNRSVFDAPLSECKFEDYKDIDISWQQRHFQMTPLFAATLASQPGQTQMEQSVGASSDVGVRATQQNLAFTPTQEPGGGGYNWMAPSLQSQEVSFSLGSTASSSLETGSSSLFVNQSKMKPPSKRPFRPVGDSFGKGRLKSDSSVPLDPEEAKRSEILKLKRRFLRDKKVTSAFIAKTEAKRKVLREDNVRRQKVARHNRVVMYRKYRVGELPDIQIKHSELIRPFQALAQHDSKLARMLFAQLFETIFSQVDKILTDEQAEETKKAVRDGLNTVMESSTHFYPPFIGSLQDVCFHEKNLELDPTAVSRACLTSMQEPIGIMLLEKQILAGPDSALAPRPAKRARGAAAPLPEGTIAWVEMARNGTLQYIIKQHSKYQFIPSHTSSINLPSNNEGVTFRAMPSPFYIAEHLLYKSLGDYDSLRGIFSSQIGTKSITKEAMDAEERGDYLEAVDLYKQAIGHDNWDNDRPLQVEEDLWDDSLLECYSHLTEWTDLERAALVNVDENNPPQLDKLWDDTYFTEHYLPHVMHSRVKLACSGKGDPSLSSFLDKSLSDSKKRALLEYEYPTELALYSIVKDDLDRARYYTGICLQSFLHDWSNIDELLVKSRATRLHELQILAEMQEYLQLMADTGSFESPTAVTHLLSKWAGRYPHSKLDPIGVWDDIVTGRCMMMTKMLEKFHSLQPSTNDDTEPMDVDGDSVGGVNLVSLTNRFSREFVNLYLKIAGSARRQNNYAVATRYLKLMERAFKEHFPNDIELKLQWLHSVSEMRLQQAEQDPSPKNIEPIIALVEKLHEYSSEAVILGNHTLAREHHLLEGGAYNQLSQAFVEEGFLLMDVLPDSKMTHLCEVIGIARKDKPTSDQISHKLLLHALTSLKAGVKSGTMEHKGNGDCEGVVAALVEMASFCDRQLRLKEDDDIDSSLDTGTFPSVVVAYSLKAMKYGSKTATQQFPRLLQLVELYPETLESFKKKSSEVPDWMFIGWISQMVALLDKDEGSAVHDILVSIATNYPQALCYPFKISSCNFKFDSSPLALSNEETVATLKAKLENKVVDGFITALELLCSPELVFKDYIDNELKPVMDSSVPQRDVGQVKKIWRQIRAQLHDWDVGTMTSGSLYAGESSEASPSVEAGARQKRFAKEYIRKLDEVFGKDGSKLCQMKVNDFSSMYNGLFEKMRPTLNKATGACLLKDYSPWLTSFQANQYSQYIEIPGQYDGRSKPLPEYHVKISGFDGKVLVMSSMRKPKRITIRGDDEKEYMFLVKGGEDLRMDQRIEQLFGTMNEVLDEDSACSQRGIRLRTYQVVPMTTRVGVIEWMENTKPLKDFLMDRLTQDERKRFDDAAKYNYEWLTKYGSDNMRRYKTMYKKASRTEVEKEYRKKVSCVPWNLLRRAFMDLSSSPEAFLTLRSHFVHTWASCSVCQYVLGIGDRHLSNYMVDMESGGVIGIDFGHAFGTATQFLPFPELIPFRLTPQITNLLLPHKEHGQLRSCMVHSLRALRNSPQILLNTMDVFVKEPSLDWKAFARKQAKSQKKTDSQSYSQDGTWYPKEKIRQAKKKLHGYNPARVMCVDLKQGHEKTQEYSALRAILMGDKKYNERAKVDEKCNTVEQQVVCLMDQATDPNILGRTWQGWEPWV